MKIPNALQKSGRSSKLIRNVALLILVLPLFTGCASIASSIVEFARDSSACDDKCQSGSSKEREECRVKCMAELNAKREQERERERRAKEDAQEWLKSWEWEETKRKQMKVMNKRQRGILE